MYGIIYPKTFKPTSLRDGEPFMGTVEARLTRDSWMAMPAITLKHIVNIAVSKNFPGWEFYTWGWKTSEDIRFDFSHPDTLSNIILLRIQRKGY